MFGNLKEPKHWMAAYNLCSSMPILIKNVYLENLSCEASITFTFDNHLQNNI